MSGSVVPRLTADDLIRNIRSKRDGIEISTEDFRRSASGDLRIEDMVELARALADRHGQGVDGIVVVQGTDTIEETAFALDLLTRGTEPVVVTGAMRHPMLEGADGPVNVDAAIQVAASHQAGNLGCLVVLNDQIHAARFVAKQHTSNLSAFRSDPIGPLGSLTEDRVRISSTVRRLPHLDPWSIDEIPPVALIKMTLGEDARLLRQIEPLGYAGLVIEGFGGGHVSSTVVDELGRIAERMPVVLASRTGAGEILRSTYGFAGSETDLLQRGLIPAGVLSGLKSRILLSLLLGCEQGTDAGVARRFLAEVDRTV